jgi:holo-[acyl-carrier protein] synthase
MTIIGVGTDILDEERIVRLVNSGGDRFLRHWYTPAEIDLCRVSARPGRVAAQGFAIKEATLKAMGASFPGPVRWGQIEVLTSARDTPDIRLSGAIAIHARRIGVRELYASTARSGGWVAAVVVAEG